MISASSCGSRLANAHASIATVASPSSIAVRARARSSSPSVIAFQRGDPEGGVLEGVGVLVGIRDLRQGVEALRRSRPPSASRRRRRSRGPHRRAAGAGARRRPGPARAARARAATRCPRPAPRADSSPRRGRPARRCSSSRVNSSGAPMSAAGRPRIAMTCSSISARAARTSSSSAGDGSSVGASLVVGDAAGETDACGLGSAADATIGKVEADDRDPDHDDDADDDGGQALGSGHCGAFCHDLAGIPGTFRFLKVWQARGLGVLRSLIGAR